MNSLDFMLGKQPAGYVRGRILVW